MALTDQAGQSDQQTTMMRGVVCDPPGGPEALVLTTVERPQPGPGQVLIVVAAAGVNRPDVLQRMGMYPPPPGASPLPGLEVAGTVAALGDGVASLAVGDRVCALVPGGGYAAFCVADAGSCLILPDGVSFEEGAALPETLFTVWSNLFHRGAAADGDHVLVHGGTSGIGTMAIALCKAFGVAIAVTAGSDDKCAAARALGADLAINYRDADFVQAVRDWTGGRGVNVVLDMVGGDYLSRNLACLADDGRHVSIAVQRGASGEVNLFDIMRRRLTLTGSTLRARDAAFKAALADDIHRTVWPLVATGQIRPVIDARFPLADAAEAHRRMESGAHVGKIVLTV